MKSLFTDEMLKEIRETILNSLVETFHVMFNLDVVLQPHLAVISGKDIVCSYVEMLRSDQKIYLSIAASRAVINAICDQLEPEISDHSSAMIEDVSAEITNIISNNTIIL